MGHKMKTPTRQELKAYRLKLGLTIPQMAKALNTPAGTYAKWENGQRRVPGIIVPAQKGMEY
jgi:DNA-binding transcriptional regulator YiaG